MSKRRFFERSHMMNSVFASVLLVILCNFTHSLTYTYPVKSVNLDDALDASQYTGLNPEESDWQASIEDPHAVHGITASDGSRILVGKAESKTSQDAFAVKISRTGKVLWTWRSSSPGKDAANAITEIPGNLVVVGGWRTVGSVGKRSLTVLSLKTGSEQYTTTSFGDSSGSHGAFEMISLDAKSDSIILSGVFKKPDLNEMFFKSYGNVVNGKAVVQSLPISQLKTGKVKWTYEFGDYVTAKTAQALPSGKIAVLLYSENEGKQASTALLSAIGKIEWNTDHPQQKEGTDLTVSNDGKSLIITGHGGNGYYAGKLTKINVSNGSRVWTKEFTVGGNNKIIYQECWGVVALPDGFVVSCGAGIEGGRCNQLSGKDRTDCKAGRGDPRSGAYLRKENNWQSFVFKTDLNGNLLWQRVDSYRCNECVSMDNPSFDSTKTGSSAAEWITKGKNDGELMVVTDEGFGVGVLVLTSNGDGGDDDDDGDGGGDDCVDNPDFTFKVKKKPKPCSWLSKKGRVKRYCKWANVKKECKVSCNNCETSPPVSKPPTKSPTPNTCTDAKLKMVISNKVIKFCSWANNKKRCNKKGVKSHCPRTCNACSKLACVDSTKKFLMDNGEREACAFVKDDPDYYCSNEGVASTCRATCNYCSGSRIE